MKTDSAVTPLGRRDEEQLSASPADSSGDLKAFVFVLFFAFGGITSLNDVLIPKLKLLFTLSYRDVMLMQSAFFAAYFIVSLPAAVLVRRIGYMRSASGRAARPWWRRPRSGCRCCVLSIC
jgi:FHS family L-fucose permease-like MFS transporter